MKKKTFQQNLSNNKSKMLKNNILKNV